MANTINIQEDFLRQLREERSTIKVITTNGFQIVGRILDWDQFTLLVEDHDGKQNLVYKSAVSTVVRKT